MIHNKFKVNDTKVGSILLATTGGTILLKINMKYFKKYAENLNLKQLNSYVWFTNWNKPKKKSFFTKHFEIQEFVVFYYKGYLLTYVI